MNKIKNLWINAWLISVVLLAGCSDGVEEMQIPESPTGLETAVISTSQIDLSWKDNSDNETGFKVERKTGSASYTVIATTEKDVTGISDQALEENTTYTYRVYAFNSAFDQGEYSNEVSAATLKQITVTDLDENVYPAVVIGTQTWMAENLKTTRYNDGTVISNITDNLDWGQLTSGAYAWYDNDESSNKDDYGALYNWFTIETGNLCPTGWHVPSDAEWEILSEFLGGESVAGGKLKETDFAHWISPNLDATNETGFTALPGGYRNINGNFDLLTFTGRWWSSTDTGANIALYRFMVFEDEYLASFNNLKRCGLAIRCVMD